METDSSIRLLAATLLLGLATLALPAPANAGVTVGVDGIWVPVATLQIDGQEADSEHAIDSFGAAAHGTFGVGPLDLGLKLNYFSNNIESDGESDGRQDELDINALGRFGIPGISLAVVGEAGAVTNTDFDGIGYDLAIGGEYAIVSAGIFSLNTGLMGQWVTLPSSDDNNRLKSFRLLVSLGVDFGF